MTRRQTFIGSVSQMCAALTHHVTPDRLKKIASSIPKVVIVTGDADDLVNPRNSFTLKEAMPEAEFIQWKDTGHAVHTQDSERFNEMLKRVFEEGIAKLKQ
jgi:pimeloyl-ACP methyl ester carboxylesterase